MSYGKTEFIGPMRYAYKISGTDLYSITNIGITAQHCLGKADTLENRAPECIEVAPCGYESELSSAYKKILADAYGADGLQHPTELDMKDYPYKYANLPKENIYSDPVKVYEMRRENAALLFDQLARRICQEKEDIENMPAFAACEEECQTEKEWYMAMGNEICRCKDLPKTGEYQIR